MHSPRHLESSQKLTMGIVPSPKTLVGILATALACIAAGRTGITFGLEGMFFSPFWPLSGVAAGCVYFGGPWMAVGVYLGVVASNAFSALPGLVTWVGPLGIVSEALLAYGLLRVALGPRPRLTDLRSSFAYLLLAPWIPPIINGGFGFGLLFAEQAVTTDNFWREYSVFILANGSSIALLAPAFAVWTDPPDAAWWRRAAVLGSITLALAWLILSAPLGIHVPPYFILVLLLASAVMLGLRGTAPLIALTTCAGMFFLRNHLGPFAGPSSSLGDYLQLYSLLAAATVCSLPVAAIVGQLRRRLERASRSADSAGLLFWRWDHAGGFRFESGNDRCLLATDETAPLEPLALFDASKENGTMETNFEGRAVLSFWHVARRSAQGEPEAVDGIVLDLSERLSLEQARREAWQSEIELRNLRASLTPHLLFNCLAAVRGIVRTDPEKAREFIDTLARFLRESTDAQGRETVPLHEEWQLCEDFLGLQAFRYERDLPRVVEIEGPAHHAQIPPMMLLNLVENAVKHGEISQRHPLHVRATLRGGNLVAEVRNHGNFSPALGGRAGGVGTAYARLLAIYGTDASLDIRQDGEDVAARLELPAATPTRQGQGS